MLFRSVVPSNVRANPDLGSLRIKNAKEFIKKENDKWVAAQKLRAEKIALMEERMIAEMLPPAPTLKQSGLTLQGTSPLWGGHNPMGKLGVKSLVKKLSRMLLPLATKAGWQSCSLCSSKITKSPGLVFNRVTNSGVGKDTPLTRK